MSRKHLAAIAFAALALDVPPAIAGGVFLDVPMTRVFVCQGNDANMEVYLPQSLLTKRNIEKQGLGGTVNGLYALDLSEAQKGKSVEPVRMRSSKDNKTIVMDQFTRKGVKPTAIPIDGGTLDFDLRFGTKAKCGAFNPS